MTSMHQKDTTFTKIFVGGLPYHTTDDTLQRFFEPYGDIEEAVVITDRQTGKSRGYGFVTMSDRAAAERACKDPNPIIDGRKANVNLAYLGAKPRIPVGELIAAFPYGLKTALPSYIGGEILGMPQIVYPSTYLPTAPAAASFTLAPQHTLLPATAAVLPATGQILDYAAAYAASPLSAGMDSTQSVVAFPYTVPAANPARGNGFIGSPAGTGLPSVAATAYATLPYAATAGLPAQTVIGQFTAQHFHPQQVQTKLQ